MKTGERAKRVRVARASERRGLQLLSARDDGDAAIDGGMAALVAAVQPFDARAGPPPTSWRKPGKVSASVPTAPPARRGFASTTSTLKPRRARVLAATSPFGPEPITIMSGSIVALRARSLRSDAQTRLRAVIRK